MPPAQCLTMAARGAAATLVFAAALAGCSSVQGGKAVDGQRVRAAFHKQLGIRLQPAPPVVLSSALSDVLGIYSARTARERMFVVVFDSPVATRQILGARGTGLLPGGEVMRRGNVVVLYTPTGGHGQALRTGEVRRALNSAYSG
jgi:hypothetical protein